MYKLKIRNIKDACILIELKKTYIIIGEING